VEFLPHDASTERSYSALVYKLLFVAV